MGSCCAADAARPVDSPVASMRATCPRNQKRRCVCPSRPESSITRSRGLAPARQPSRTRSRPPWAWYFFISRASRKPRIFTTALTIPGTPPDFPAIDGVIALLNRIVGAAGLAGLLSGLLLTGVQQLQIAPLIRDAERYEAAAAQTSSALHDHAAPDADAGTPQAGLRRTINTALANIVVAIGFALLLASAMSSRA